MDIRNISYGSVMPSLAQIPQGTGGTEAAGPQDKLAVAQTQLSDKEARAAQDMKTLEKAQNKSTAAGKWETRFGTLSGKAGRISLPLIIASIGTGIASSFLAIPALATIATVASVACTANTLAWLGGLGASKLSGMARKKAEKDLPALTSKVQMENRELVALRQEVGRLSAQQSSSSAAASNVQQSAAAKPQTAADPVQRPADRTDPALEDDDDEPAPAPRMDAYSDDETLVIGGIRIRKNQ